MGTSKKKKVTKKKVIKPRQEVKLSGRKLKKFIDENGYNPNTSKLPDGMTLGAYEE